MYKKYYLDELINQVLIIDDGNEIKEGMYFLEDTLED
jgi:hypothetical protein